MSRISGVYLSRSLDLAALFDETVGRLAPDLDLRPPERIDDPATVRFAVCWEPADDAFDAYPNLGMAASIAAGIDGILAVPSLPDIPVTRVRDPEQARIMAGHVVWNVLWWHRRFGERLAFQAARRWERLSHHAPSTVTIGILGFGLMGRAAAEALLPLGFRVVGWARTTRGAIDGVPLETGADGLDRVVAEADFLINLLPLTEATRGLLGADLFAKMPKGAVLIQVGRGAHLDEAALLAALDDGRLGGASLDVFAVEPLPADHPLWSHPKVLVTAHDAAEAGFETIVASIAEDARRLVAGQPLLGEVPRDRGY
ncbi:MAG: glyoxylate/hydroxypyruvate reductase A [Phyllobacteriaceae bacterium]|nr:glyoxylate/hydroxypyruvate reductase A [Phyllobacteriaceae bacterium]